MIRVDKFEPHHAHGFVPRTDKDLMDVSRLESLSNDSNTVVYTLFNGDDPIVIFGAVLVHSKLPHYMGFAFVSDKCKLKALAVVRALSRIISATSNSYQRLEVTVDSEDAVAQRFAKLLGFEGEGYLRYYGPKGEDHVLLSKVGRVWL